MDENLYKLLDIDATASEGSIKKAYRQKALRCHPDKNPDNPRAAEQFHKLSEALAILLDPKARKAYDNVLKAKQANELRNQQLDKKRKKLKDDLEAREFAARKEAEKHDVDPEKTFQAELERLRQEGKKQMEEEQERIKQMIRNDRQPAKIKIRWKIGSYNEEDVRTVFSKYGDIDTIVIMASKKVGLVEMATKSGAELASKVERGFADRPLKVKLLDGSKDLSDDSQGGVGQTGKCSFDDFESLVMRQMRQAEERKRLRAEILRQDAADEPGTT